MVLNYSNVFSFFAYSDSDSDEESFEESNIELYPNKQNFQTVFFK